MADNLWKHEPNRESWARAYDFPYHEEAMPRAKPRSISHFGWTLIFVCVAAAGVPAMLYWVAA